MPKNKRSLIEEVADEQKISLLKQIKSVAPRLMFVFSQIREIAPRYLPLIFLNAVIRSAQIAIAVYIPKLFLDALTAVIPWRQLFVFVLAAAIAEGLLRIAQRLLNRYLEVEQQRVYHGMSRALAEKITRLPYNNLEDPETLTLKEEASFSMSNQGAAYSIAQDIRDALQHLLTILTLLTILSQLSILLVSFLLVTITIIFWLQNSIKRYETKFYMNLVGVNRKYGYYLDQTFSERQQQQIRIYNLEPMLNERVAEMNLELSDYMYVYLTKLGKVSAVQSVITNLQAAVSYGYAALRVLSAVAGPRIGIGSFSLYAASSIQFTSAMREILNSIRNIKQNLDFLEPFERFMKLPDREAVREGGAAPLVGEAARFARIEFEQVSFTYPGADQEVLRNVSFKIEKGEKISVVGLNGAGKTTLVKLLCRFFRPDSGRILINGRDIWDWPEADYLKQISAVFQDYRLLPFSIQSNITSKADEIITADDRQTLMRVTSETGVQSFTSNMEQGLSTLLNKSIHSGATELSGGQAQKVAIARALFKSGSLVILDEPTSALDPLAEAEIYEHFDTLVHGQTAIYISHRMSSSRFCDKVLVLDGGTVVGFDPHDKLIQEEDSLYTKLFDEQKKYYQLS